MNLGLSIAMVLLFVLVGGAFAATEMALVSLREGQLRTLERGTRRQRRVAALARDSTVFLSAVQIGVTFAGFLSSAFGAATLAPPLVPVLASWGVPAALAEPVALVGLTLVVSYLSLVLGELVPKRIALVRPEGVAVVTGPPLATFATAMRPVIALLRVSTDGLLRLLGIDPRGEGEAMTDEEVRDLVSTHEGFDLAQRAMLNDVLAASQRQLAEVMRHRSDMAALPLDSTLSQAAAAVHDLSFSRYPVFAGSLDDIVGFVHVRDILQGRDDLGDEAPLSQVVRDILVLPGTSQLTPAMQRMRTEGHHLALIVDEYGGTDGLVTLEDLIEELVGEIWDEYDAAEQAVELRLHETKTFDGATNLGDFAERTGIVLADGPYETIAGWMLARLGRIAVVGDALPIESERTRDPEDDDSAGQIRYELEVSAVDRNRITQMRLRKRAEPDRTADDGADDEPADDEAADATTDRAGGAREADDERRGTGAGASPSSNSAAPSP